MQTWSGIGHNTIGNLLKLGLTGISSFICFIITIYLIFTIIACDRGS